MILRKIDKWYTHIHALINRKRYLDLAKKNDNDIVRRFVDVCELQIKGGFNNEEIQALNKLDKLRNDLLTSDEIITFEWIGGQKDQKKQAPEDTIPVEAMCKNAAIPQKWGEFLFRVIREMEPEMCLELGTNIGVSASYSLSALDINKKGFLVTLEGNKKFSEIASINIDHLGFSNFKIVTGLFKDTLGDVLNEYKKFDYVFIDGHHDKDATLEYFEMMIPFLSENSIIVFDDINWSKGMQQAWKTIVQNEHIQIAFDFYKLGIVIFNKTNSKNSKEYRIVL